MIIRSPPTQFNLDAYDAGTNPLGVLVSGGAAVRDAAGGLPRRATGLLDYSTRVLALAPTGYWRLREAASPFADSSGGGHPLALVAGGAITTGQPGHARGGDTGTSLSSQTGFPGTLQVGGIYPAHQIVAGTPATVMVWVRGAVAGPAKVFGTQAVPGATNSPGYSLKVDWSTGGWFEWVIVNAAGTAYKYGRVVPFTPGVHWYDRDPHLVVVRYTGGDIQLSASWQLSIDGIAQSWSAWGGTAPTDIGASIAFKVCEQNTVGSEQDVAIWSGTRLTDAQVQSIGPAVACGTARWTLPVAAYARTLRGFQVPGRLARADLTRLGVRAYYQIGAAPRVEFDPGTDPAVAIPAGSACYLDADLTHHHLDDLPWIADSLGGGPVALWEEGDPAIPTLAYGIEQTAVPSPAPSTALALTPTTSPYLQMTIAR